MLCGSEDPAISQSLGFSRDTWLFSEVLGPSYDPLCTPVPAQVPGSALPQHPAEMPAVK